MIFLSDILVESRDHDWVSAPDLDASGGLRDSHMMLHGYGMVMDDIGLNLAVPQY